MTSEEQIHDELKKLKKPYPDPEKITVISLKEGLAKKVETAFILKCRKPFRVVLIEKGGKIYVEFYNLKDLRQKWIVRNMLNFPTIIKESAHYLKNGAPEQRKYFKKKITDSSFRNIPDKKMKEYLKSILP